MDDLMTFYLRKKDWEKLRDGWADVACWHRGFNSARPGYQGPPQIQEAGNIIEDLKAQALRQE